MTVDPEPKPEFTVSLLVRRNPWNAEFEDVTAALGCEPTEVCRQKHERNRNGNPLTDWAIWTFEQTVAAWSPADVLSQFATQWAAQRDAIAKLGRSPGTAVTLMIQELDESDRYTPEIGDGSVLAAAAAFGFEVQLLRRRD